MFWRTCPSDELQGAVLGETVLGLDREILRATVLYLQDPYGEGLASVFASKFPRETSLVPFLPFTPGDDLSGYIEQVDATNPDAVLIIAVQGSDTIALLKAMVGNTSLTSKKFFFTDGSKDASKLLEDPTLPDEVKAIIQGAKGTAPAAPAGDNYDFFAINLATDFAIDPSEYAFLAQAYDATYIGAYGTLYAESVDPTYNGRLVAEGLSRLIAGADVNIKPTEWTKGKAAITAGDRQFDVLGTSGQLDFDPSTGEAPAPIEVWYVLPGLGGFETDIIVEP
jgi:ABC-type branched-subunit amino acid transport system substrate-binding protein